MIHFVGNNQYPEFKKATLEEAISYCSNQPVIGVDIETTNNYFEVNPSVYRGGLDPYLSKMVMLQVGDLEKQYVIDCRDFTDKELKKFNYIFEDEVICKVGHNLQFEGKFFLHFLKCRLINVWDTFISEKVLWNGYLRSNSLEALMYRYLDIRPIQSLNLFNPLTDEDIEKRVELLIRKGYSEEDAFVEVEKEVLKTQFIDKSTRLEFLKIGNKPFTIKQIEYGASDITRPLLIKKIQEKGKNGWIPDLAFRMENAFTQVLSEMTYRGVPFSSKKWKDLYEVNLIQKQERKLAIDNYVIENHPKFASQASLFDPKPSLNFEWSSSKQVVKFFKTLDLAVKAKSKSTGRLEWTVGSKELSKKLPNSLKGNFFKNKSTEIVDKDTFLLAYLLFKKSEQLVTTFGMEFLKYVHPITGKIHPGFNQLMISGRLSSNKPNSQNIPSTDAFRACFCVEEPWYWISSDYSGEELRIAAKVHNVPKMISFFKDGDSFFGSDFHSFSATQMMKKIKNDVNYVVQPKGSDKHTKEHSQERGVSKNMSFKLIFGGSAYTVAQDLGIELEEAETYMENFFKGLPGMLESFEKYKQVSLRKGEVIISPITNRKYFFPLFSKMQALKEEAYTLTDYNEGQKIPQKEKERLRETTNWSALWSEYMSLKGKLERRSLNLRVQGLAAEILKVGLLYFYNWRWEKGLETLIYPVIPVHDEINTVAHKDYLELAVKKQEEFMIKAGRFLCKEVPMEVDTEVELFWKH